MILDDLFQFFGIHFRAKQLNRKLKYSILDES